MVGMNWTFKNFGSNIKILGQRGDTKQVPYCGPIDITRQRKINFVTMMVCRLNFVHWYKVWFQLDPRWSKITIFLTSKVDA
jgi:hypothetical protein